MILPIVMYSIPITVTIINMVILIVITIREWFEPRSNILRLKKFIWVIGVIAMILIMMMMIMTIVIVIHASY